MHRFFPALFACFACAAAPEHAPIAASAPSQRAASIAAPPALTVTPAAAATPARTEQPAPAATAAPIAAASAPAPEYGTPLLDAEALARESRAVCERALSARRPVLLEFSAPWCKDCRALERLKQTPPLRDELAHWELFAINVGDGFQHPELMRAFRVDAIAKLVVASSPRQCGAPLRHWPPRAARSLHGVRDAELANRSLAAWLAAERARIGAR